MRASSGDAGACRTVAAGSAGRRAGRRRRPTTPRRRPARARHGPPAIGRQEPPALADDLADGPGADRGQLPAEVLGDGQEEALDHLGRAGELGAQVLALGGDARSDRYRGGTGGPCRSRRDQRRRPERELLGAQQRRDEQVAPGLEAAVGAQHDAVAQAVAEQDLVDLGEAELPRRADVLDRDSGDAPVPPAWPDRWMYVAPALTTPAAIVPTPRPATSFTPIRAAGLMARRSAMSWARSSIE